MSKPLQASFLASAVQPQDLPPESGPEIAFAGRSNVGKSSAINALANRKRLAFASRTPGRTRAINFFALEAGGRLVDLPGYGYASAPRALRAGWDELVGGYLRERRCLAGIILLTDARRPLGEGDRQLLGWIEPLAVPCLVLLSKCDKLTRREQGAALAGAKRTLAALRPQAQALLFSGKEGEGVEEARDLLQQWLRDTGSRMKDAGR